MHVDSYYKLDKLREFQGEKYPYAIEKTINHDWITTKNSLFDNYRKSFVRETDRNIMKSR